MSGPAISNDEFFAALARLIDGVGDDGDRRLVDEAILHNDAHRELARELLLMEASLAWGKQTAATAPAASSKPDLREARVRVERISDLRFPIVDWKKPALIAAALLLAAAAVAIYVFVFNSKLDTRNPKLESPVAVLLDAVDARWLSEPIVAGASVPAGPIRLAEGMVRFELTSGVTLTLLGPVDARLSDPMHLRLNDGRAFAHVPHDAAGFKVITPGASVVDLGTEFGVDVDADARSAGVHVFEGRVEVRYGSSNDVYAAGSGARVVDSAVVDAIAPDIDRFTYRVTPPLRYAHFSFDGDAATRLEPVIVGPRAVSANVRVVPPAQALAQTPGPIGHAVRFTGDGAYLATSLTGAAGNAPRTFAAWVKVPRDVDDQQAYAFVAWGKVAGVGGKWQIAWNRVTAEGPLGVLRCEVSGGFVMGTTDLRDDRWHHVAVVYGGGKDHPDSDAIRLYVDGIRESVGASRAVPVNTITSADGGLPVQIGRYLGASNNTSLRADVDELYLIDAALTAEQIKRLKELGDLREATRER